MRIAILATVQRPSGGYSIVLEHGRRLQRSGHEVFLIHDHKTRPADGWWGSLSALPLLPLENAGGLFFDFALACGWESAFSLSQLHAKQHGYFAFHEDETHYRARFPEIAEMIEQLYQLDLVFLTSNTYMQQKLKGMGRQKTFHVPCSIRPEFFTAHRIETLPEILRILVVGPSRFTDKRIETSFEVLSRLDHVHVTYVNAEGFVPRHWKIDRYYESLPFSELPAVFASCDCLLHLSRAEGFSLPVFEMFATGGTAVVTRFDGHEDYLRDEQNCLLVPVRESRAINEAIH